MVGRYSTRNSRPKVLPYKTLTLEELAALPIGKIATSGCHLWLWTTNQYLPMGFDLLAAWGFTYLAPITWVKPNGFGAWFVHRTQTLLFSYKDKCVFPLGRYKPTVFFASARRHSQKPEESYQLIESVSPSPRLEVFARKARDGWDVVGNEIDGRDISEVLTT